MNDKARRSWLIVPASRPHDVEQAAQAGADIVVLDLFEFVVERDKAAAREGLNRAIESVRRGGAEAFVQIDPAHVDVDLAAAVWPGLTGVVVARAETPGEITAVASALDDLERERGIAAGTVQIVAALETAPGNHAAYDIVRSSPRVAAATLGRADLAMDLRPEPSGEIHLMPYLMQRLVIVARAAGVTPIGAWWRAPDRGLLATPESSYQAANRGRAIGFKGAMCIRANQVDALNRGFSVRTEADRAVRPERSASGVEG
jgi:citrate lyase subunit beta/citryl-CoA lyase